MDSCSRRIADGRIHRKVYLSHDHFSNPSANGTRGEIRISCAGMGRAKENTLLIAPGRTVTAIWSNLPQGVQHQFFEKAVSVHDDATRERLAFFAPCRCPTVSGDSLPGCAVGRRPLPRTARRACRWALKQRPSAVRAGHREAPVATGKEAR